MANKAAIPFLVAMMLLTGVCNTLLTKYQDMQCVRNCDAQDPASRHNFEQPVWQTVQMFIGEMGCWLVVFASFISSRLSNSPSARGQYEPLSTEEPPMLDENGHYTEEPDPLGASLADAPNKALVDSDMLRAPLTGWRIMLLALPASCDITGTTLMNVGLLFVAASIYQMTRGALVLFVGLFSVLFLHHHLSASKWAALSIVVIGVALVGLAGIVEQKNAGDRLPGDSGNEPSPVMLLIRAAAESAGGQAPAVQPAPPLQVFIGILLIFLAQVFTASQFVLEESIMHRYSMTPLRVVGWEGVFGFVITLLGLVILHFAYGVTPKGRGGYFDAVQGWHDMTEHVSVAVSSILIMISIGGFNFFGLSVTRSVSATSRSTIDTCRTLFIWVVSLGLGWESFKWLQVVGFAGLVYGTFLFNEIVTPLSFGWLRRCLGLREDRGDDVVERPFVSN